MKTPLNILLTILIFLFGYCETVLCAFLYDDYNATKSFFTNLLFISIAQIPVACLYALITNKPLISIISLLLQIIPILLIVYGNNGSFVASNDQISYKIQEFIDNKRYF